MVGIQWEKLGFDYMPVRSHIRYSFKDGAWDDGRLIDGDEISMSIAATALHYGQTVFEGLKAFTCADGKVRLFRPRENARRLNESMRYILAPEVPEELFLDAVQRVVVDNIDYVPPYGSGGSLYIRPFAFGSGAKIGVGPSDQYEFIVAVMPVSAYYKGGIKPVDAVILDGFDRAAPHGTGHIKLGGNYAASMMPSKIAKERGFPITLFLDAETHTQIDEFGTSNFIGVTRDGKYVTPKSRSILRSITNMSLRDIAAGLGIPVEERPIMLTELGDFAEVGACGTAVVITPVGRIVHGDDVYEYGGECGPVLHRLYNQVTGIQYGEIDDSRGWMTEIGVRDDK